MIKYRWVRLALATLYGYKYEIYYSYIKGRTGRVTKLERLTTRLSIFVLLSALLFVSFT